MGILSWVATFIIFVWLLGLLLNVGGLFIHLLLLIALISFIADMFTKK